MRIDAFKQPKFNIAVKETVNIPTTITVYVNTKNAHVAVAVRCLDQHGYSLIKILFIL